MLETSSLCPGGYMGCHLETVYSSPSQLQKASPVPRWAHMSHQVAEASKQRD